MIPQLIIITGLSGSGMSSAMNVFEDLGYFCVDNLPVQLIPSFVHLFERKESGITRAAIGVNIREGEFLKSFPQVYAQLRSRGDVETTVLFLEASDAALQRRYSETRRPHPLGEGRVIEAILEEREKMLPIRPLDAVPGVLYSRAWWGGQRCRQPARSRSLQTSTEAQLQARALRRSSSS